MCLVLSRSIAELGIYPAVDPLDSTSRILDVNVVGARHYKVARDVQKILQVWLLPVFSDINKIHKLSPMYR